MDARGEEIHTGMDVYGEREILCKGTHMGEKHMLGKEIYGRGKR